jgi:hypothetical protein
MEFGGGANKGEEGGILWKNRLLNFHSFLFQTKCVFTSNEYAQGK